ncbi:RNA polymerase sigma factor [Pedobacter sp. MC2016-24]|uniref:RNA polymerase sigma factor n=1 Tax=Pedobacter sp. MC2016-24 TaxID=2780090 RepID=UPI0018801A7F|nr:RNA polymerase sigma-70 factor [Pedobacter sp. MC2016-24]MBE9600950.1 RNA polymerase sigma-70 factor [Pedobacter sp. MC2016-24]
MLGKRIYTDEELLLLIIDNNSSAFELIFNKFSEELLRYVYRKLKNKEEAQDIVQDVFVSLFKNRDKLVGVQNLSSYLYRSALNKVFDVFKHKYVVNEYIALQGNSEGQYAAEGTDFFIREQLLKKIIDSSIEKMPPKMKEIFLLKKYEYLSTRQIAEKLGVSELTVSTQLKRATKILRLNIDKFILLYLLM